MRGSPDEIGTRKADRRGFISIKVGKGHPYSNSAGWQLEHRLVIMEHLGRRIGRYERVVHLDGDRFNNDLANLLLVKPSPRPPHCPTCLCTD